MAWFKLDDKVHSHPKTIMAGNAAFGLWARLGSYCSDHLTDGIVPREVAESYGTKPEIKALLRVGFIEVADGGYRVHDYLDYNPPRVKVLEERRITAERVANFRRNKRTSNGGSNGVTGSVGNGVGTASPDPDPKVFSSQNKTDRQNTGEVGRSVEFDATVSILVAHAEATTPNRILNPDRWRQFTEANILAEKGAALERLLGEGHSPQSAAEAITGDGLGVRNAMRAIGLTVEAPAGWGTAS